MQKGQKYEYFEHNSTKYHLLIITYSQFIEKANVFKANLFKDPELRKAGTL